MTKKERREGLIAIVKSHNFKQKKTWKSEEKSARNRLIYDMLVDGMTKASIAWSLQDIFGIGKNTSYVWVNEAIDGCIDGEEEYRKKALEIQIERLSELATTGSEKARIAALDQINKLLGLYKEKVDLNVEKPIEFTFS